MKARKALKRLEKAEALMSDVIERFTATEPKVQEALQDAKTSVDRAKEAVQAHPAVSKRTASKKVISKRAAGLKAGARRSKKSAGKAASAGTSAG
ncbi:MAG: hypothetical protein U0Q18_20620 [Bryobacteraceae bacterium]